jgi:hypothetical protein
VLAQEDDKGSKVPCDSETLSDSSKMSDAGRGQNWTLAPGHQVLKLLLKLGMHHACCAPCDSRLGNIFFQTVWW